MSRAEWRLALLAVLIFLSTGGALAQVPTGTPPFGSFAGGPDVINLANLNAHITVPVLHKAGRGLPFTYDLSYDSSVWYPVGSSGSQSWQPVANFGWRGQTEVATGYVSYKGSRVPCGVVDGKMTYGVGFSNWFYHDPFGASHAFPNAYTDTCGAATDTDTAADGSGYTLNVNITSTTITSAGGTVVNPPVNNTTGGATATDRNGNQISVSGTGVFTDTLGTTVLTVSGTAPNPLTFTYTASSGASATFTMSYLTRTVKTNFGCSGIAEYGPTSLSLVDKITLPNGSFYQFTYEPTPGFAGDVTGRLASVTLPTGGTISYAYSGGTGTNSSGVMCVDGSTAGLTRTTPDGVWTYSQVKGTGAASTTTITDPTTPTANQTVIQFQGLYETQRDSYQGAISPSNLLGTVKTCYNGNTLSCTSTAVTLPITQRTVFQVWPGTGGLQSRTDTMFNTLGQNTEVDEYDYGSGSPGSLVRKTLTTYATVNNGSFVQIVKVQDGSGITKYRQDTTFDGVALGSCPTGVAQHDYTNYGCSFNSRANPTSVTTYTDPVTPGGGITKNFTYDVFGNLLTAQLNCCQTKTWSYSSTTVYAYPDSVMSGTSGGTHLTTSYAYNNNTGLVTSVTDPNNLQTQFAYDSSFRLTTVTLPDTTTQITTAYDDTNFKVTTTTPIDSSHSQVQVTAADSLGRPSTTTLKDGTGNVISITQAQYDQWGRQYKVSNPYTGSPSYWTTTQFDALGRPTKTTLPDGKYTAYSYGTGSTANTATVTDPSGKQKQFVGDGLGRLTSVYEPDVTTGNLNVQTSYTFNVLDQLTQVTQGAQTRTYVYDALGRLNSATTPEAGTVCFGTVVSSVCQANGYDSFNNLLYRTDARGVLTTYSYDTLNRPTGMSYNVSGATGVPATASVTLTYGTSPTSHNNGLLTSMADGSGSESYTYNSLAQLSQLQKVIGSTTYTTQYTAYNLAGEPTSITYPSGRVVTPGYDAIGRLSQITSGSVNYQSGIAYNTAGKITGFNYGNGINAAFGYSADRLQLNCLDYSTTNRGGSCAHDGTTKFGLNYYYTTDATNCANAPSGNNGQVQCIKDTVDNGRSAAYTYDALHRLTNATTTGSAGYPAWGLSETYDRYGNRTAQSVTAGTGPSNSVTVSTSTNRITTSGYSYDLSGNMTADGLNTLVYDAENRTTSATNGSTSGAYVYDGGGTRVKKCVPNCTSPTTTTVYIFAGSRVIAEYVNGAAVGSPTRENIYGTGLLAKIEGSNTLYYHQDHLSNRLLTDSSGNVAAQSGHFPLGETWYDTSTTTKWKFTSYERDAESGNDYAMARYYVNRLGRFNAPDPIAGSPSDPQTLNRYAYVRNDPMNGTDPTGLSSFDDWIFLAYTDRDAGAGGGGGGSGISSWYDWAFSAANHVGIIQDPAGLMNQLAAQAFFGKQWYNLPGNSNPAAEAEADYVAAVAQGLQNLVKKAEEDKKRRLNCIKQALNEAFGGYGASFSWDSTQATPTIGGHINGTFTANVSDSGAGGIQAVLNQNTGFGPGSRINTSYGSLHVSSPNFQAGVFTLSAHVDLANPNNGLGGFLGHAFGDYIGGHVVQWLRGDLDKRCP